MASRKETDTKDRILDVVLDLIAERGFHDAPISEIAKRAGTGPGLIYHYFPSKEYLIHQVYLRVRTIKRQALTEGYSTELSTEEAYTQQWIQAYHFYKKHTREARFLEQYENSPYCGAGPDLKSGDYDDNLLHFLSSFRPKKAGGVLADLPPEALHAMSFGLALKLASSKDFLKPAMLKRIAAASWRALTTE